MKSEHRHELAENDLSKLLARWGTEFDKHANTILSVLIVVALVAAGVIYWTRTSAATSAAGWANLSNAASAEEYVSVAEDFAGTQVAEWATLRAGDGFLREGIRLSLTDRTVSNERLAQAREAYDALLKNTGVPPVIREQALLGYAATLESLSDGDTGEAVAAYEKLTEEFPDSRFHRYALDRISELKTGAAQDFYAWFHRLNPTPPDLPGPQDQPGLQDQPALPGLPDGGDLSDLVPEAGSSLPDAGPFDVPETPFEAEGDLNPFGGGLKMETEGESAPPASSAPSQTDGTGDDAEAASEAPEAEPDAEPEPTTEPEPSAEPEDEDAKPAEEPASESPKSADETSS